jgi:hypothetical protein
VAQLAKYLSERELFGVNVVKKNETRVLWPIPVLYISYGFRGNETKPSDWLNRTLYWLPLHTRIFSNSLNFQKNQECRRDALLTGLSIDANAFCRCFQTSFCRCL